MVLTTGFSQSFSTRSLAGSPTRYAFIGPALPRGATWARLTFKAPPEGPSRWESVYFGAWSGSGTLDLDQTKKAHPLFGGANSSPNVAAGGLIVTDPFQVNLDSGDRPVWRYDLNASSGDLWYPYSIGLGSGYYGAYKSGAGGASNGDETLSGYSMYSGNSDASASVAKIELADSLEDFETGDATVIYGFDDLLFDNCLAAAAKDIAGVAGKRLHVFLNAPTGSGIIGLLEKVVINPSADTLFSVRSGAPVPGMATLPRCNAWLAGGVPPKAIAYHYAETSLVGSQHDMYKIKANENFSLELKWPIAGFAAGDDVGVNVALHQPGVSAAVSLHWREMPAA